MHVVERLLEPHQKLLTKYRKALTNDNPNKEIAKLLADPVFKTLWPVLRYKGAPTPCLRNLKLTGLDYSGTDLSHLDMRRTVFTNCSLGGAVLSKSTLTRAVFARCNLIDAVAEHAHLYGVKFDNSVISNLITSGSDTRMATALPKCSPAKKPVIKYMGLSELVSLPLTSKPAVLVGPRRAEWAKQFSKYLASFDGVYLADHAHLRSATQRHANLHLIYLYESWDQYLPEPALGYKSVECIYHPEAPNNRKERSDAGLPRKVTT